jgi:hypothetical protein
VRAEPRRPKAARARLHQISGRWFGLFLIREAAAIG